MVVVAFALGLTSSAAMADTTSSAATAVHGCTVSGCGSNTPVLFGTPIVGLSVNGTPSDVGIVLDDKLERIALSGPRGAARPCPEVSDAEFAGLRLRIQDGEFVAMSGQVARCEGDKMLGVVFSIRVPVTCNKKPGCRDDAVRVRVMIEKRSSISTWEIQNPQSVPTYRLVWYELPSKWPGPELQEAHVTDSVCPRREAWMESWQHSKGATADAAWHDQTDHLIPVQGETYTRAATIDPRRTGKDWFNLACVGTAIAKMRLLGYDPMQQAREAAAERQATLKMLTARYRGSLSFTSAGTPLAWEYRDPGRTFWGTPEAETRYPEVESYWNAEGASCLLHRRTWSKLARSSAPAAPRAGGRIRSGAGASALPRVRDLVAAAMRHAMPEVEVPPEPPVPAACRQWDVMTSACSGPLDAAYAVFEQTVITTRIPDLPRCSSPPPDHVWVTYPVNHVAHAAP